MEKQRNIQFQEQNDLQKLYELLTRNYKLFAICLITFLGIAFLLNKYAVEKYRITSVLLIKEDKEQNNMRDALNANLFGTNKNLQNELLLLKSSPVIATTIQNLDLSVDYYQKKGFQYYDIYKNVPFKVMYANSHVQPLGIYFKITFNTNETFDLWAKGENVSFYNFQQQNVKYRKEQWEFISKGKIGELIENNDLSFIIAHDSINIDLLGGQKTYYFNFSTLDAKAGRAMSQLAFSIPDKNATALEINMTTSSVEKGLDIVNGIINVYIKMNLERKNHLAEITINYIDKQLGEISDSLSKTEQKLQNFRSENQLLDVKEQSSGISSQFIELQNKMAELTTNKRYYENVLTNISENEDFSNLIVPSSMGIQDPLNNTMMQELITAQSQKNLLIQNNQEKNPQVKKLTIQIDNLKKTIAENISNILKTNDIALDEVKKRITRIQSEISRMPSTERQLIGIERKYRLNDAIYNYLMEKRAEANITRSSNLPDMEIIEPANGSGPVSPNKRRNYLIAIVIGLALPFSYLQLKSTLNTKITSHEQIEKLTEVPILGKILHNTKKTNNVVFDFPNSGIAESYRALRTNLEYYVRGGHKKVILVTSCIEGEGKSFNSLNIAMSYAQLGKRCILIDFDLRKKSFYFNEKGESLIGISSYLINKANLEDIILKSPNANLDYIPSGPIPPNPVELIGLEKTEKLVTRLKDSYDYIILDTPPLAQVTDAYLLLESADVKVIITRLNYSIKNVFSLVLKDLHTKNINNLCIVLNDNKSFKDQYGYGYGYNKKNS